MVLQSKLAPPVSGSIGPQNEKQKKQKKKQKKKRKRNNNKKKKEKQMKKYMEEKKRHRQQTIYAHNIKGENKMQQDEANRKATKTI